MLRTSIGNGVAKELTCMTHGHEQSGGDCGREWGCLVEGAKGENWDKCHNIINNKKHVLNKT